MKRSAAALITIPLGVLLAAGVGMSVATASGQSVPATTTPAVTAQHDPVQYPASAPATVTTRSHVTTHPPHHDDLDLRLHDGCDHNGTWTSSQHMGNHR